MINEKFSTGMSEIYLFIGVVYEVKLGVYEVHNIPQLKIGTLKLKLFIKSKSTYFPFQK